MSRGGPRAPGLDARPSPLLPPPRPTLPPDLSCSPALMPDCVEVDEEEIKPKACHRHYDSYCEEVDAGKRFAPRAVAVEALQRRMQSRLGVSRVAALEPIGAKREEYYEQVRISF